ncbi:hypothetical protein LEP1GSC020_2051 [Leptospira interrogans serovar Grippotyphosa str. 2006006986]|nr:hypothetical protein LEP1GSC020_2051 [Leptospira interrogans serovar Grippotyphosa str. 2006006986]
MGLKIYLEIDSNLVPYPSILNRNNFWNLQFHSYSHPSLGRFLFFK